MTNFQLKNGSIAATRHGNGSKLLIAVHGYGDSQANMQNFAKAYCNKDYTVYTFDLPLHGEGEWQGSVFTTEDFAEFIDAVLAAETAYKYYDLAGYSLGGRVALSSLGVLKNKPQALHLFASAGAPQNKFHPYFKVPLLFKTIVQKITKQPNWLVRLARFAHKINLISAFQLAFTEKCFTNEDTRNKLFFWWNSLHFLPINKRQVQDIIVFNQLKVHCVFGKKDVVIPKKSAEWFEKNFSLASIKFVDEGHRGVIMNVRD